LSKQFIGGEKLYISVRMLVGLALLSLGIISIIIAAILRYRKNDYAMLPGMLGAVVVVIGMVITIATQFY